MPIMRVGRHPRAQVTCSPVRWREVCRRAAYASAAAALTGAAGGLALLRWWAAAEPWAVGAAAVLLLACAVALLSLAHLLNVARTPVTFTIANGELLVTRPFLFWRRRRRLATSSVRGVRVSATAAPAAITTRPPTGRLSIRRRGRLPLRVPGRRPLAEVNRVAEELRAVLRV